MPTIPSGLRPVVQAYSGSGPGGVRRTEVAGGAARYGLQFDRGVQRFQVTLVLKPVEFSVWTTFYHHVIKKGAIAFEMHLDSGYGAALHSVNIVPETYTFARTAGVMTSVSFSVEAESQAYEMTTSEALALLALFETAGAASSALLERLAEFANEDSLVLA